MLSDEILVKKFREGNESVFKEIFDHYYFPVKAFACHYVQTDEIIEDFVQDAFLNVWEKRSEFYFLPAIKSFLYTSVKNACLNYLKHVMVHRKNESGLILWMTDNGEEEYILEEEVHAMIYEAVKDLSEQSRKIVVMTMEGKSNQEISSELNVSVNTVKTLKLRAYRILRERLKGIQWFLLLLFGI